MESQNKNCFTVVFSLFPFPTFYTFPFTGFLHGKFNICNGIQSSNPNKYHFVHLFC